MSESTPPVAPIRYRQRTRWGFHAIATVATAGLWTPVAGAVATWNFARSGKKTWAPVPPVPPVSRAAPEPAGRRPGRHRRR